MSSIETMPSKPDLEKDNWQEMRNKVQVTIMSRMGVPTIQTGDKNQDRLSDEKAQKWITVYAQRFAEITDGDLKLQGQLMSDDIDVERSAIEEVVSRLQSNDEK